MMNILLTNAHLKGIQTTSVHFRFYNIMVVIIHFKWENI